MKRRHVRNMPSLFLLRIFSVVPPYIFVWSRYGADTELVWTRYVPHGCVIL